MTQICSFKAKVTPPLPISRGFGRNADTRFLRISFRGALKQDRHAL